MAEDLFEDASSRYRVRRPDSSADRRLILDLTLLRIGQQVRQAIEPALPGGTTIADPLFHSQKTPRLWTGILAPDRSSFVRTSPLSSSTWRCCPTAVRVMFKGPS